MGRFNLLDEPWISVLIEKTGEKKDVSMLELFHNAQEYHSLAGEMETQNFVVMRFLLAVIHTVFSRVDVEGNPLPGIVLDERWLQLEAVDEDDFEDYEEAVEDCWKMMYENGRFPETIAQYLEMWRDHFFLYDQEFPIFQVNENEMCEIMKKIPKKKEATAIFGKNLNRTISESENKTALFAPVSDIGKRKRSKKDAMTDAEFTRWLVMFHAYTGLADKVSLTRGDQRSSKGWLFDIGGVYLKGDNLFENILLNYIPICPVQGQFLGRIQKPCWEVSGNEVVKRLCLQNSIDNLAELYTNWSRAVYVNPKLDINECVKINVVKLPEIEHSEKSIEPMTLWKWNENGPNKNCFTPKKHLAEQSLWRHFGIITGSPSVDTTTKVHPPGIFSQLDRLAVCVGSRWTSFVGVSMEDDGNATSWLPVDEIVDDFQINDLVITDKGNDGWVIRINDAVETTKKVVSDIFRKYLRGICEIRGLKLRDPVDPCAEGFIKVEMEQMYSKVDILFKEWISAIEPDDSKEDKINEWYGKLRSVVVKRGEELFDNSTVRDLKGIETENIVTKYWQFVNAVNRIIKPRR